MKEEPFFEIGLCMAGAVSAGAYTAGVMDYLIETLDKWEQAHFEEDEMRSLVKDAKAKWESLQQKYATHTRQAALVLP